MVGFIYGGTITNSYSSGSVTGSAWVGGLVGNNYYKGTITNSYSSGSVTGSARVGGLVSCNSKDGTITNSYSTGTVSGSNASGLVSYNGYATITNCYWDIYRSGQSKCVDENYEGTITCTGKNAGNSEPDYWYYSTHAPMGQWDFVNIWGIEEGVTYPYLRWQFACTCGDICVNETGWWRGGGVFNASNTPIQHAIDNATAGETICVEDGTYIENVVVDKELTIVSSSGNPSDTVIEAADDGKHVIEVIKDEVTIQGFTIKGATGEGKAGIYLHGSTISKCEVVNNTIEGNYHGVYLHDASDCEVKWCLIRQNDKDGLVLDDCNEIEIVITNVEIVDNGRWGISAEGEDVNVVIGRKGSFNLLQSSEIKNNGNDDARKGGGILSIGGGVYASNIVVENNDGPGILANENIDLYAVQSNNNKGPGIQSFIGDVTIRRGTEMVIENQVIGNLGYGILACEGEVNLGTNIEIRDNAAIGIYAAGDVVVNAIDGHTVSAQISTINNNGRGTECWVIGEDGYLEQVDCQTQDLGGIWSEFGSVDARNVEVKDNGGPGILAEDNIELLAVQSNNNKGPGIQSFMDVTIQRGTEMVIENQVIGNLGYGILACEGEVNLGTNIEIRDNAAIGIYAAGDVVVNAIDGHTVSAQISTINNNGRGTECWVIGEDGYLEQVDCQTQDLGGIWSEFGSVDARNVEVKDNGGPGILAEDNIELLAVQSNNNKGPGIQSFIGDVTIQRGTEMVIENQVIGNLGYGILACEGEVNLGTNIEIRDNAAIGIYAKGDVVVNAIDGHTASAQISTINNNGRGTECWVIDEDGCRKQVNCQTQCELGGIWSEYGSVSARIVEVNDNGGHGIWSNSVAIRTGEICRNTGYGIVVAGGELDLQHVEVRENALGGIRSTQGEGSAKISPNRMGTDTLDIHGNPHAGRFNAKGSADGGGHSTIVGSTIADNVGDGIRYEGGTNPLINWNNIYNNTGYGLNNLDSSVEINARYNWWGNSSGPSGAGPGTGEEVSDYVDYRNWLVAPVGVVPCIEVEKSVWDPETEEWTEEIKADAGDMVRFQLFVHNDGINCSLSNIVVNDTLPSNLEYADNATVNGIPREPDKIVDNKLIWNFVGPLEPCENITIEFDARVIECGDGENLVNATAWCEELDYGVKDEDRAAAMVLPSIEVEKKVWDTGMAAWVKETRAEVGDNVTFQLWIHHDGSCCPISSIVVEDTLPEGLEFVSAEPVPSEVIKNPDNTTMARWNLGITLEPCENTSIEMVANVTKGGEHENEVSANATGCGYVVSDTDEASVIAVGGVLEANFRFVPTEPAVYQAVRFFDETTGGYPPYSYQWDFNNDTIVDSTEANPTWNYTVPGTYTVTLKVNDTEGNTDTTEKIITVHLPPNITAFAPPSPVNDTFCNWRTFNVTVNQTVNVSWYLNGSLQQTNESVREASCTRHAEVVGEHNVSAIASNENGTDMQMWIWNVTAAPLPVLEINKTGVPDPVSPDGTLNYSISVNNTGYANATNVTVMETYDKNVTFVSAVPAPSSGNDTWKFAMLNVSETRWINISVTVNASVPNGTVLHNIVNVTCDEGVSDFDTEDTTVLSAAVPVLEINKTDAPDPVPAGGTLNYSISVNNTGNATATNVMVMDTYDENVTFVMSVPAPSSGDDTWKFATLNVSETRWINISVTVNASVLNGTVLHNIVNVSCAEGVTDTDTENTTVFAIPCIPNVKISKWVKYKTEPESEYRKEIDDAKLCNNVSFKIAVQNNGTGTNLTGISVTDVLNCSLGYINDSASIPPTIYEDNCPENQTLKWTFPARWLEPCEYINITFDAHVDECGNDTNYARVKAENETGHSVSDEDTVWVNCTPPGTPVETATGTGTAYFATEAGTIEDLVAVDEATLPAEGKPTLVFPHGFFSFNITGLTPGQTVVVTITLPDNVPVGTEYWKYHASEGGWIQIPMGSDDGDNVITITLVDGGLGDDDGIVNGVIVDQGGPGIPGAPPVITFFAPPSPVNDTVCTWRTFNVTVNQTVNVSWYLNGSFLFTNASVREASCTRHAEVVGEHNVSAIASNGNGTDMQTWVWNVTAVPILEITKTGVPDPVSPVGALNYTIRVNNAGNATATNVTVTETYDGNVTVVAAVPAPSSGDDTWQFATLNVSETRWINVSVIVNTSVPNGTVLHNIVNVSCDEGVSDTDTENTTVFVVPVPVLEITKTDEPDPVSPGGTLNYTISVNNTGNATATNVTVTERYDKNVTFVAAVPAPSSGNDTWQFPTLNVSETRWINISVTVNASVLNGTVLHNIVNVSCAEGVTDTDTENTTVFVAPVPVLEITKTDNPDPVSPGGTLNYTISVNNTGNATATNVIVVETYDENVTFVEAVPAPSSGDDTWQFPTLNVSETRWINVSVTVNASVLNGTVLHNIVNVTCDGGVTDSDTENTTVFVAPVPVLEITKTDNPDPVSPGGTLNYTISVNNTGNATATNVTVMETYDKNVTFVSAVPVPSQGNDTWQFPTLNVSETRWINISVTVNASVPNGTVLHNIVNVSCDEGVSDSDTENTTVFVAPVPALEINKTDNPDPVSPGGTLNYTISVNNTGNATATNVTVMETYDENVTFVAAVPAPSSGDGTWQFPTLNASETRWINISVIVNASVLNGTVLHNSVNVSCAEGVSDTDTADTTVFAIPSIPNVKISKWVKYKTEPDSEYRKEIEDAKVCNNVSFKIAVQNNGTGTNLTGISVTDVLNCSLGYINGSANIPPTTYENNCPVNQTLLWQFATVWLEPGKYINITFDAHVDECGSDRNYARVDAISGTGCNVSDEDYVYVNCTVPVCVETATGTGIACFVTDSGTIEDLVAVDESTLPEEGKPKLVFPHGFFSFNITGLTQGQTVEVTLTLPDIVPVGTEYWKYHASEGGWIRIPMGSDDGDNILTITLVDGGLGDDDGIANGVIVDQGGPGVRVTKPTITKSAPTSVAPGGTITYTILYANVGPVALTDVTITENYPEGVTFISADPAPDAGTNNKWTIGTLPTGTSGQISIKVKVPESRDLSFTETGSVIGEGFVMVSKDLSTEQKPYRLKNVVTITCAETDPVTASASTTVSGVPGTSLEITEHGSGIYESEEILNFGTKNKSIRLQKSTEAEYQPTSFYFSDGFSVVFTNMWMQDICSKSMVLGDAMHKKIKDATYIRDETKTETGEYGTELEFASSFHGAAHIGVVSKDVTTSEDYIGEFEIFWAVKEECQYLFNWSRVPGDDSENLIRFLVDNLAIKWAENATITKSNDDRIINISTDWHSAEVILAANNETATVKVANEAIYVLDVRTEDGSLNLNVYDCKLREISESVTGEGYVMVDKELASGHIQVVEHGSGIYSSDTDFDSQRLNKSTEAEYQPTTFNFSDGFGVNFSSNWMQSICSKDKKAGTAIQKKISDAVSIADDTTATKSSMAFETSFNGSIHVGARTEEVAISEDYIGRFNVSQVIKIGDARSTSTSNTSNSSDLPSCP